ncbi:hypothetical protein AVEN_128728-1 [Araneus ventricosus]|uniref:Uncharacterized protein n=1 Tax=Araneus ventricosus TaxID=182803 RepID=A0A4Y2TEE4_ARAVE|nr:hypothetical protein AVEN_128728-1 [Araneus ventricosus]
MELHMLASEDLVIVIGSIDLGNKTLMLHETQEAKHKVMEWSHICSPRKTWLSSPVASIWGIRQECCMRLRERNTRSWSGVTHARLGRLGYRYR